MASESETEATASPLHVLVELRVGDEPITEVLEALDAALSNDLSELAVTLRVPSEHPGRAVLERICEADHRIEIADPPAATSAPAALLVSVPVRAHLGVRSLERIRERALSAEGRLELVMTGPSGLAARISRARRASSTRILAVAPGAAATAATVTAAELDVSAGHRRVPTRHRPVVELGPERAEHLRHRARSATYRARVDRQTQRLSRERMQTRHERSRLSALEQALAEASPREWAEWRSGQLGAVARSVPKRAKGRMSAGRSFVKRGRRLTIGRLRRRRVAKSGVEKKLPRAPVPEDQPRG